MTRSVDVSTAARKFFAATSREALRMVREALGAEAMVLTNRVLPDGVEIVAMATEDVAEVVEQAQAAPVLARAPAAAPQPEPASAPVPAPAMPLAPAATTAVVQASVAPVAAAKAPEAPMAPPLAPVAAAASVPSAASAPFGTAAAPAPTQSAQAHSAQAQPDVVLSELHSMRGMLEEQMASLAWNEQQRKDPVRGRLLRSLLGAGFSAQLSRAMLERLPTGQSYAQGMAYVRSELMRVMSVREDEEALLAEGGVYALMGPTGVGKTTTTAKLAARCVMRFGADKIALVTTDSYRIGAYEQLRIYGQLLDVPVYAVKDAADLHMVLKDLREKHLVLIDTVGMSQRDRSVSNQIAMLCSGDRPVKRLLLLNATSHGDTLNEVVHAYRSGAGELAGCIFTKVDEATHTGALIDTVIRHRLTVHYVSSGQKVPENLMLADRGQLVDGVFQPRRHAALFTAAGDTEAQDKSAEAEIAQAQAETDRLRAQYQQLIRAMAHDAQAVADSAAALNGAAVGFAQARKLWGQAGDANTDQRAVLEALMAHARQEVAAGCEDFVLAVSGQLGLQASDSGDRYVCQASLLLSDRDGQPLAAPRQWLSTASPRKQGLRQMQWLREQDLNNNKPLVHLLPRLPAAEHMAQLRGTQWMARVAGSTAVVDVVTGQSGVMSRLDLDFGPAMPGIHKGRPAVQTQAQIQVRLRASADDVAPMRCVVTRLADVRSGKLLAQTYALGEVDAQVDPVRIAQWLAWAAEAESCLRLIRQGLALCGGMGEPGDPNMFKRLLIAAQVATTVWRVQAASGDWAERARGLLVQLTGRATRPGRAPSGSVLFAGMDKLFSLLDALGPDFAAPASQAPAPAVARRGAEMQAQA